MDRAHLPARTSAPLIWALLLAALASGCVSQQVKKVGSTQAQYAQAEVPPEALLQVAIVTFDPGIPDTIKAQEKNNVIPAVREAEAKYLPHVLRSALHLHRMRYGLHDPGQAVYLQALATLADGAAAEEQVTVLMRRQLALQRRQLLADEAATGVIEALPALIETLRNSTVFAAMAEPIGELREAVHTKLGNDHPAGVPLLIADAHASALHAIASEGLWDPRHLREAYRLMTSLDIDMPVVDRAQYLVDVGNVWWLAGHRATALAVFKVATDLKVPSATERLGRPEALAWPSGTPRALTDAAAEGWLRLGIRINPRGDVMRVTDAAMSPRQDPVGVARARAWQSAVRRAIWRPAVVDGRPATRKDMVIFDRFVPTP